MSFIDGAVVPGSTPKASCWHLLVILNPPFDDNMILWARNTFLSLKRHGKMGEKYPCRAVPTRRSPAFWFFFTGTRCEYAWSLTTDYWQEERMQSGRPLKKSIVSNGVSFSDTVKIRRPALILRGTFLRVSRGWFHYLVGSSLSAENRFGTQPLFRQSDRFGDLFLHLFTSSRVLNIL